MKKRILTVALLIACMAILSSCGCKHEWTEADCLNPRTCNLCEAVEGEALGHDWQAATCEAPETCTRCALTQGSALGHSYGIWAMGEAEMTRTCEACGGIEAVEPDYDVYLQQEMQGHWGTHFIVIEGNTYTGFSMKRDVLLFNVDVTGNQMRYFNMEALHDCTWAYESHEAIENGVQYWLLASKDGEPFASVSFLKADSGETSMVIPLGGESYAWLKRFEEATEVLEGTWVASDEGRGYRLNICKDGTFTGTLLDGEASGTWHLRTVTDVYSSGSISAILNLSYERDGAQKIDAASIYFGRADADWSTYRDNASISLDNTGLSFRWIAEDQVGTWESALAEAPEKLVGEWTGTQDRVYDYNTNESTSTVAEGYTLTFLADGTFAAVLGEETIEGIWYFDNVFVNSGSGSVSYSYRWKYAETDNQEYFISVYDNNLSLNLPSDRNSNRSVDFMQLTEENLAIMAEAKTKPVGVWTSTRRDEMNGETGVREEGMTTAYSLEILEDGTFVARLGEEFTGKWMFGEVYTYDNGVETVTNYMYTCKADAGNVHNMSFTLQWDGTLTFDYTVGEINGYMNFAQMDAAEKAALEAEMEEAKLLPVGTWVSHTYTTWNSNTQEGKDEPHSGYTLTIREDGTLTAQLEEPVESTWTLSGIYHGDGYVSYSYSFDHDLPHDWSFSCNDDGGITLGYYKDGISHNIHFEKE